MIPGNQLGDIDRKSSWLDRARSGNPLIDFEKGGVALNNSTQGLRVQTWMLEYTDGSAILTSETGQTHNLFARSGITQIGLAFDQLMAPFVAFEDANGTAYWWFNPGTSQQEFSTYLTGAQYPRCTQDDTRALASGWSDIILAFMRGNDLYYRQQRDNYAIERLLLANAGSALMDMRMSTNLSLQFRLRP